jgi:uncharacterized membrane-anchored protein
VALPFFRRPPSTDGRREPLAAKVPEITAIFWVIKLLTTGIGESASDFLGQTSIPLAGIIGVFGFWFTLRRQVKALEYRAREYWAAVLMVAVFGTMVSDGLRRGVGISYGVTSVFFGIVVAVVFFAWYRSEGTLSIHTITTRRRETFYWSAVLATFAFGTAAGDWTALTLHLGFFGSALLFGGVIVVLAVAWRLGLNSVLVFWSCYVITRPLGASFVDGFSKPHAITGLDLGDGPVTGVGLIAFLALVAYVALRRHDVQMPAATEPGRPPRIGLSTAPLQAQPAD